ncbi:hypothetical protein LCGC14_2055000 [marine sediment metagenome]|uniref:Uncharacterized protein n=1 Tax=marine sediment metagenome TaxID=412755 RepID=A0A0F9EMZ8_9ZZZZ
MAKPTADTDKELIQQIKNLKEGIEERAAELSVRGYSIVANFNSNTPLNFSIEVSKTVNITEVI